jgi:hypothetical protein
LNGGHPSFYALDRARLGLALDQADRDHVNRCETCSAHLARQQDPPPWLAQIGPRGPRRRRLWPAAAAGLAAMVFFFVIRRPAEVREKGGPVVTVFVKRGEDVFPWDGAGRLRANDRLRLRVAPGGYDHVSVASLGDDGEPAVLYEGELPVGPFLLPLSFRVDDRQDGPERLSVMLGHRPIPPGLHQGGSKDEVWRQVLVFDKEPSARSAP